MKVLLVNGSPYKEGNTFIALSEAAAQLNKKGVESEIFQLGTGAVHGCIACGKCNHLKRCVFDDDVCNALLQKMREADGIIIGTPVYYAGVNGALCAVLDRVFYASQGCFAGKPAASVVCCRRGGASASFDRLNKYFTISRMPVASSQYWNSVHGMVPGDAKQDLEGLQTMRTLADNIVWLMECIDKSGIKPPEREQPPIMTNMVR